MKMIAGNDLKAERCDQANACLRSVRRDAVDRIHGTLSLTHFGSEHTELAENLRGECVQDAQSNALREISTRL